MFWGLTIRKCLMEILPLFVVLSALGYRQPDTLLQSGQHKVRKLVYEVQPGHLLGEPG